MARTFQNIRDSIISAVQADPVLAGLTSTSSTAIWRKWVDVVATQMAIEEQLNDQFVASAENVLRQNAPANVAWIQKMLNYFQYSATTPQAIQLDTVTLNPYYPTVDPSLNIITRNAIITSYMRSDGRVIGTPGVVLVKVAKGTSPTPLTTPEQAALQSYLNIIKPAGVVYEVLSVAGDFMMLELKVWYDGAYASTIQTDVKNAYLNYLASLPFNGVVKLSDLEVAIKSVAGVSDVEFINVNYRRSTDPFVVGTYNMVDSATELQPTTAFGLFPYAGYVVDETTSGYDFSTLNGSGNFIAV